MNRIPCINALAFPERVDTNDGIVLNKWTHYFEFRFFVLSLHVEFAIMTDKLYAKYEVYPKSFLSNFWGALHIV